MLVPNIPATKKVGREAPGMALSGDTVTFEVPSGTQKIFRMSEGQRRGQGVVLDGNGIQYFTIPKDGEIFHASELLQLQRTVCEDYKTGLDIFSCGSCLYLKLEYVPVFWKYRPPKNPMTVLGFRTYQPRLGSSSGWRAIPFTIEPELGRFDKAVIASQGESFIWEANCTHYQPRAEILTIGQEVNCYGK